MRKLSEPQRGERTVLAHSLQTATIQSIPNDSAVPERQSLLSSLHEPGAQLVRSYIGGGRVLAHGIGQGTSPLASGGERPAILWRDFSVGCDSFPEFCD